MAYINGEEILFSAEVSNSSGGKDGATFTPYVSESGILSWTNDKGLENPDPVNIKGADGKTPYIGDNGNWWMGDTDTGVKAEGKDGTNGKDGANGTNGKDGVSATHSWNGTTLTITSASGTSSADLKGADGKDGVDGKDYVLTPADKTEIATKVVEMLGGSPILGIVDENNNIILSGNLTDGTYTLKFENEDGTYSEIGTLEIGTIATNLFTKYTPLKNQRWSQSSTAWKTQNGCVGFEIPMNDVVGKTMRFSGFMQTYANGGGAVSWYAVNDNNSQIQAFTNIFTSNIVTNEGNNTYSWVVPSVEGATKLMVFLPIRDAEINESHFSTVSWTLTD